MWVNIRENLSLKRIHFVEDTIALTGEIKDNSALEYLKVPQRSVTRSAELWQAYPQNPKKFAEIAANKPLVFETWVSVSAIASNSTENSRSATPEIQDDDEYSEED